jgi:3-oxoacyl-[acyl-carrier protein] reductase
MKLDFKGQIVLVTGATRGIGKQIADDLAMLGAELILTGTNKEQVAALNQAAAGDRSVKKKYYAVDFTDNEGMARFVDEIGNQDRIDVCVNNAGINRINYIDETLVRDWEDMLDVNVKAPFMITRAISKIMKRNLYGRMVNISSIFGVISKEKRSIYSVTKFGIRGMTVASSNELARYNILVNSVSPGFVLTELTERNLSKDEMDALAAQVPARRFATPDDISRVVLFLASSLNTYITGQNIIVDGGYVNV